MWLSQDICRDMFLHLPVGQDKLAFSSTCKAAHLASLVGRWLTSELGCLGTPVNHNLGSSFGQ